MLLLLVTLASSCWLVFPRHTVEVELVKDAVPPSFRVTGDERLKWIWVVGPAHTDIKTPLLWKIIPKDNHYPLVKELPVITYGVVPSGWIQETPSDGSPPPSLQEGNLYGISVVTSLNFNGRLGLVIEHGKAKVSKNNF